MNRNKFTTRTELKSLRKSIKCAKTECGRLRMLKVCLGDSSMRLGVPFIASRQLGAAGGILGRQFLPSVVWRTGQSGAPSRPLAGAMRRARIARSTIALAAVGSPDSPVNYSRTPSTNSREWLVRQSQPGAPDTIRCTTGHCPVHPD
jgi:hypothetical protein